MAIGATAVWEIRTTGSDTNGGGYVPGAGTDYSQQTAPQLAVTDAVANGTTTLTSATAGFTAEMVGNVVYLAGGSGSLVGTRRQITAFGSATSVTLDALVATGTGVTANVGGALASPGALSAVLLPGHLAFVAAGTYTLTTATVGPGGPLSFGSTDDTLSIRVVGYNTTRTETNTDTTLPVLLVGTGLSSLTVVNVTNYGGAVVRNLSVDGAGKTSIKGFSSTLNYSGYSVEYCRASNCTTGYNDLPKVWRSWATACGTGFLTCVAVLSCASRAHTSAGFQSCNSANSLACLGSGASADGFVGSNGPCSMSQCTSYGNGRHGANCSATSRYGLVFGSVLYGNSGYGLNIGSNSVGATARQNAAGSNTSGASSVMYTNQSVGLVTLTADPFANSAGASSATTLDALFACFLPNATAGGGALLRAAGYPSYADLGAVQHQDAGGGGGAGVTFFGGFG